MPERALPAAARLVVRMQLVRRRLQGEPVAYIRGSRSSGRCCSKSTPSVLIPRPGNRARGRTRAGTAAAERAVASGGSGHWQRRHRAGDRTRTAARARDRRRRVSAMRSVLACRNAARLQIGNVALRARQLVRAAGRQHFDRHRVESALRRPPTIRTLPRTSSRTSRELALDRRRHRAGSDRADRRAAPAQHLQPGGWLVARARLAQGAARSRDCLSQQGSLTYARTPIWRATNA